MAYRQKRDEWAEFLQSNRQALRECGIPEEVLTCRTRFLTFLDHGYDEVGWAKSPHVFFDARILSARQIVLLAELAATQIDERYRVLISSRWQRA